MSFIHREILLSQSTPTTLFYLHDPMCSWCYGFAPVLDELKASLPDGIRWVSLVGGLAPDSDEPMAQSMRDYLQQTWRRIEQQIPGARFNFDFWTNNTPRRSTYPACRAVITARLMADRADDMTRAIQRAYYREAANPSDVSVLCDVAASIGLDREEFERRLASEEIEQALISELDFVRELGVQSFPSLVLQQHGRLRDIALDYLAVDSMLHQLRESERATGLH